MFADYYSELYAIILWMVHFVILNFNFFLFLLYSIFLFLQWDNFRRFIFLLTCSFRKCQNWKVIYDENLNIYSFETTQLSSEENIRWVLPKQVQL
jgi:hypothetical protein